MKQRFNLQNGNLLELDVNIINDDIVDITQISYNKKNEVEEQGNIIICKWALESILRSMESKKPSQSKGGK